MLKTVPELANALGINRLRIYRYIKKESIAPTKTDRGVQYFNETIQNAIIKHFQGDEKQGNVSGNTSTDTKSETSDTSQVSTDILKLKSDIIRRQDNEIKRLAKQNESLQRTIDKLNKQIDQQQQLELESIRTIKSSGLIASPEYRHDTGNDTNNTKSDIKDENKKGGFFRSLWHSKG